MLVARLIPRKASAELESAPSFLNCCLLRLRAAANQCGAPVACQKDQFLEEKNEQEPAVCEGSMKWLSVQSRHANVAVEMHRQGIHATAPCWLLAGPLGCHEPTCQRAGVISQGGFRTGH